MQVRRILLSMVVPFTLCSPAIAMPSRIHAVADRETPRAAHVAVVLPLRNAAELETLARVQGDPKSPFYHQFLSVAQFRARYAPSAQTFRNVTSALRQAGLSVDVVSSQGLRASGSPLAMSRAFGTHLVAGRFARESTVRFFATAPLHLNAALQAAGAQVVGLESIPMHHVESERANIPANRYAADGGYWFTDLKEAYDYSSYGYANGKGATIGIVMSSDILDSDLNAYFNHEKFSTISGKPNPMVIRAPIFGGSPFGGGASAEAAIDTQQSLGSAPGATEMLYNIPDLSDPSIIAAYTAIVESNVPDVISSSFGGCELGYTKYYNNGTDFTYILKAEHNLYLQGNVEGQTFLASSGDEAGLACPSLGYYDDGKNGEFVASVSTPASDPNVTGVGGTNLETTTPPSPQPVPPVLTSKYVSESEYGNALMPYDIYGIGATVSGGYWGSGSGRSGVFTAPSYQSLVTTGHPERTVPDISMQMGGCPYGVINISSCAGDSYGLAYVGGQLGGYIGTSLSSPEFAGLLAVEIGHYGQRFGNANPLIYALSASNNALPYPFLHQNIPGYNGVVSVSAVQTSYNPIVGVGTPRAKDFWGLPNAPFAQDPQTPNNP